MTERPTTLYRWFDAGGRLLYVGITCRLQSRLRAHGGKSWAATATRIEIEQFATRKEASDAEERAILTESPLHNAAIPPDRSRNAPMRRVGAPPGPTRVQVEAFECFRCSHVWVPRPRVTPGPPRTCPRCKSPYWATEPHIGSVR